MIPRAQEAREMDSPVLPGVGEGSHRGLRKFGCRLSRQQIGGELLRIPRNQQEGVLQSKEKEEQAQCESSLVF